MKGKHTIIQKVIAMLVVFVMALSYTEYASYAIDMFTTNSNNVQFKAYFKEGEIEIATINREINAEDIKLYMDISVKNEGYLKGQISLENAGFRIKEEFENEYIEKIENNVVYLKQINAEEMATVEVGIEYQQEKEINLSTLKSPSKLKLGGTYYSSKKELQIDSEADVTINWKTPEGSKSEIVGQVLTNKVYEVEGKSKRIVQLLVGSRIENNTYPVKETQIEISKPEGVEKVEVHKRWTNASNGNKEFTEQNYTEEEKKVTIRVQNVEEEGKISWQRNVQDVYILTYEIPEGIEVGEIKLNGKIITYDEAELIAEEKQIKIAEEKEGIISVDRKEKEEEIYKGKIYIGEERDYESITRVYVDYAEGIQNIEIQEGKSKYIQEIKEEGEKKEELEEVEDAQVTRETKEGNILYKNIKFNKENVEKIFGKTWSFIIEDQNKNQVGIISDETEIDENGNIVLNFGKEITKLKIETGKPVNNGILQYEVTKAIAEEKYTREEIKELGKIENKVIIGYTKEDGQLNKIEKVTEINLKETETKANIGMSKDTWIANKTNENIEIIAKLNTEEESKNMFKNPEIDITFPKEVTKIKVNQATALYQNGLEIENKKIYIKEDGRWAIYMKFKGEQKKYDTNGGTEIHLFLNVDLGEIKENKEDKIVLEYTNENDGTRGKIEKTLKMEIAKINKIQNRDTQIADSGNTIEPQIVALAGNVEAQIRTYRGEEQISETTDVYEGETIRYEIIILNNSSADIENINVRAIQTNGKLFKLEKEQMHNPFNNVTGDQTIYRLSSDENHFREIEFDKIEKIKAGKNITLKYEAVADKLEGSTDKKISGNITFTSDNGSINTSANTMQNIIKAGEVQVILSETLTREDDLKTEEVNRTRVDITNLTQQELRNVDVKFTLSKELSCDKDRYITFDEYGDRITWTNTEKKNNGETEISIKIGNILANEEITIFLMPYVIESKEDLTVKITAKAITEENHTYYSNKYERIAKGKEYRDVEIEQKAYVGGVQITEQRPAKDGDVIEIVINVTNNGDTNAAFETTYNGIKGFNINQFTIVRGENSTDQTSDIKDNTIWIKLDIQSKEKVTLKIKATLNARLLTTKENFESQIIFTDFETKKQYSSRITVYAELNNEDKGPGGNKPVEDNSGGDSGDPTPGGSGSGGNSSGGGSSGGDSSGGNSSGGNDSQNYQIEGTAWIDSNKNGKIDSPEKLRQGIEIKVVNSNTGKMMETSTKTGNDGKYKLELPTGKYVILFFYDSENYDLTTYKIDGANETENSDVITKSVLINGEKSIVGATDEINLAHNVSGINIGMIEKENFDIKIEKYVSKVTVANKEGTKIYKFKNGIVPKVEIRGKYLSGSVVSIEYTFNITNIGETSGTVEKIIDSMPSSLQYQASLNTGWDKKENKLYNETLKDKIIKSGETKRIKLVLTKTMTASNTGLVTNNVNMEEIYSLNNTEDRKNNNNKATSDLIITVSTGGTKILLSISIIITIIFGIGTYIIIRKYAYSKI